MIRRSDVGLFLLFTQILLPPVGLAEEHNPEPRPLSIGVTVNFKDSQTLKAISKTDRARFVGELTARTLMLLQDKFPTWTFSTNVEKNQPLITVEVDRVGSKIYMGLVVDTLRNDDVFLQEKEVLVPEEEGIPDYLADLLIHELKFILYGKKQGAIEDLLIDGAPLAEGGEWLESDDNGFFIVLPLDYEEFGERLIGRQLRITCERRMEICRYNNSNVLGFPIVEGIPYGFMADEKPRRWVTVEPLVHGCRKQYRRIHGVIRQLRELALLQTYLMGDDGEIVTSTEDGLSITVPHTLNPGDKP